MASKQISINNGFNMLKSPQKFQRISETLSEGQLRQLNPDEQLISAEDLLGSNAQSSLFFLGFYSQSGLELAMRRYGVFEAFERLGFENIRLLVDTKDPYRHRLAIYSHPEDDVEMLLAELVLRRQETKIKLGGSTAKPFNVLYIEWLTLRNPNGIFTQKRPKMPGQEFPGLGGGRLTLELLVIACKRLGLSGIANVPEHFHNAHLYSRQFSYIDPVAEGKRRAIASDLMPAFSLAEISWGIDLNCVTENGNPFTWFTQPQLFPLIDELKSYFETQEYTQQLFEAQKTYRYVLDTNCLSRKQQQKR